MEQLSFFDPLTNSKDMNFPLSHEDVCKLIEDHVHGNETDEDFFTWSETKAGKSYFIYGTKVFEHVPGNEESARLKIYSENKLKTFSSKAMDDQALYSWLADLAQRKKALFRALVTEPFGCCNSFLQCSDAGHCLFEDDRFYNGCYYRKNLESGKIFYGKNANA